MKPQKQGLSPKLKIVNDDPTTTVVLFVHATILALDGENNGERTNDENRPPRQDNRPPRTDNRPPRHRQPSSSHRQSSATQDNRPPRTDNRPPRTEGENATNLATESENNRVTAMAAVVAVVVVHLQLLLIPIYVILYFKTKKHTKIVLTLISNSILRTMKKYVSLHWAV